MADSQPTEAQAHEMMSVIVERFQKTHKKLIEHGVPPPLIAHATFSLGLSMLVEGGTPEELIRQLFEQVMDGIKTSLKQLQNPAKT